MGAPTFPGRELYTLEIAVSDIPIEREVKLVLESRADYERLCAVLPGFDGELAQHNSYWDLPSRALTDAGVLLRVRVEGERARITCKQEATQTAEGVFESSEDEEDIPLAAGREIVAGRGHPATLGCAVLERLAARFGVLDGLRCWGELHNLRRRYGLDGGWLVEVDCTTYPGGSECWEVELESEDPTAALEELTRILNQAGIPFRPGTLTKSERLKQFLDELAP